jgi:LPXTG-site transpeptidase (sortase) family protein
MPDEVNGNLILMAHSGDAYISYFAYLYKLNIGDDAYVTYAGNKYHYQIVNIYEVPKIGVVSMDRNKERTTLTMITCTKDNDYTQTIYIAELVG